MVVNPFRKLFKKETGEVPSFRHAHYLNTLSDKTRKDLLHFTEQSRLAELLPEVQSKKILSLFSGGASGFISKIENLKPFLLIEYQTGPSLAVAGRRVFSVKGELKPLPFQSGTFDVVFFPFAAAGSAHFLSVVPELERVLANGGRLVVSVVHPFLQILLQNQNPRVRSRAQLMIEDYFSLLRDNHFYVESIIEGRVDKETRPFFVKGPDIRHYEEFLGIPLVLMLRAVKFVRASEIRKTA